MSDAVKKLSDTLNVQAHFTSTLPADPLNIDAPIYHTPRRVEGAAYSWATPITTQQPTLVAYSAECAKLLGFATNDIDELCSSDAFAEVVSGNRLLTGMQPYSCCYGGHQFGRWAEQLGDGRAINLGEVLAQDNRYWTLQLKGAGPTPYSRHADGLAVLRSSMREFLCSEAMHHLGIPTTRALSLTLTGDQVMRDMFYDGNPEYEPGAITCRLSPSFLRFGSFELPATRQDWNTYQATFEYSLQQEQPELWQQYQQANNNDEKISVHLRWFDHIAQNTATLINHWMRVGFVHGVMNTDNLATSGVTIDYGPYGWLEDYDPNWTPNTTDAQGKRYSYENQPAIGQWNLLQLANSLYGYLRNTLVPESTLSGDDIADSLELSLRNFKDHYEAQWLTTLHQKLGLKEITDSSQVLIDDWLELLQQHRMDMTLAYRTLSDNAIEHSPDNNALIQALQHTSYADRLPQATPLDEQVKPLNEWLQCYQQQLAEQGLSENEQQITQRLQAMQQVNPKYIIRNYLAQEATDLATQGDFSRTNELLDVLRNPYTHQQGKDHFCQKRPAWADHKAGCSMLSCSS